MIGRGHQQRRALADEVDVSLPLGERVGHSLVLGTTRVGKTRLAELFVTQDIRRRHLVVERDWPSLDNYPIARASISVIVR